MEAIGEAGMIPSSIATNTPIVIKRPRMSRKLFNKLYMSFITTPKISFIFETAFLFIFLILFSVMILCDFYYERESTRTIEKLLVAGNLSSSNSSNETIIRVTESEVYMQKRLGITEWIVIVWMFSYFIDELRQMMFGAKPLPMRTKIRTYFESVWNVLDFSSCIIFFIGLIFRVYSIYTSEKDFVTARILYATVLALCYLRLLHVCVAFRSLGPKLVMIRKMVNSIFFDAFGGDLIFFY
jgi:hypothetical protein